MKKAALPRGLPLFYQPELILIILGYSVIFRALKMAADMAALRLRGEVRIPPFHKDTVPSGIELCGHPVFSVRAGLVFTNYYFLFGRLFFCQTEFGEKLFTEFREAFRKHGLVDSLVADVVYVFVIRTIYVVLHR